MTTTLPDPVPARSRRERLTVPFLAAGAVLVASLLLHLRDPHQTGSWGLCPWLFLTGTSCPACGGLRAVNDLTHGDVVAAASSNLVFVASIPLLVAWWGRWTVDRWRGVTRQVSERRVVVAAVSIGVMSLVFWVVRNLAFAAWLTP